MPASLPVRLLTLALSGTVLISSGNCSPLDAGRKPHVLEDLSRRQGNGGTFAITGADSGSTELRLEIRDLKRSKEQWNLYLLGLQKFQAMDQNDKLSWYSIMGIHGMPFKDWDGVPSTGYNKIGYCVHSSNIFMTWHRPYAALYEQLLWGHVQDVANALPESPDKAAWVQAAKSFRAPYLDWAVLPPENDTNIPDFLTSPKINVTLPNGTQIIDNPLFQYRFHPLIPSDLEDPSEPQFQQYQTTLRYPTSLTADAQNTEGKVKTNMQSLRVQLRDALYDLFVNYDNFTLVSSMASYHPAQYQSFETIHGWVHNYVGGSNGNMLEVPWSAFDPFFMLHHIQVDRVLAIWQTLHPDSYVLPEVQDYSTYTINAGSIQDVNSPLTPFHSDSSGTFWTSESCRDWKKMHYDYPETQNPDINALRTTINNMYGQPTIGHPTKRTVGKIGEALGEMMDDVVENVKEFVQPGSVDSGAAKKNQMRTEYSVNYKIDKFALGGSGSIYVFLGPYSGNPDEWRSDESLLGASGLFVGTAMAPGRPGNSALYGSIPITNNLEKRVSNGDVPCMEANDMIPYLQQNMAWAVTAANGTIIPNNVASGLEISVTSATYRPAAESCEFPERIGKIQVWDQITHGKPGGLQSLLGLCDDDAENE
ncbi:hypothetical protein BKA81DRAFT_405807 [Phyllosticta paracitricarpa]|uniref:tyrosinase n=1 Tax=Phyllosticta paracitricarpa TaxID=2016321 RepID=A0ABR1NKN1_9PEZI